MPLTDKPQHTAINKQVANWETELRQLASQIATARGTCCAVVMIMPTDEDYGEVVPELILEDALRVNSYGWPEGFSAEVLNPST